MYVCYCADGRGRELGVLGGHRGSNASTFVCIEQHQGRRPRVGVGPGRGSLTLGALLPALLPALLLGALLLGALLLPHGGAPAEKEKR